VKDTGVEDAGVKDSGTVDGGKKDGGGDAGFKDAGGDAGQGDGGAADGGVPVKCVSFDDCTGATVCDFALGLCETRDVKPASTIALFDFKPPEGGKGDVLVVDGHRFFSSIMGALSVKIKIGAATKSTGADENRAIATLGGAEAGVVTITGEGSVSATGGKYKSAPSGIIACDGSTPAASGEPGATVYDSGPYAAGYVDDPSNTLRVYYPAECGSVRRPPVQGTFPLISLLHGNGALYLNYEYLAQHLATWGFVSIMPESADENDTNNELQNIVEYYLDTDLGDILPILKGVRTGSKIAHVGHSRGTARMEIITGSGLLESSTAAAVFLGPVDNGVKVPAGYFMTFHATGDLQSGEGYSEDAYGRQDAPKWFITINGGNHSLFSDHKVWLGAMSDELPTITRSQQFRIVTSFVLPMMERAFGMTEHFPGRIDSPPPSPDYTVKMEK
ncbi:MAG: hypothetical protein WC889_18965, partial [Myxococcota bacterium]